MLARHTGMSLVRSTALALTLGAVGGALFQLMHVPLAWMLGPMCINIAAATLRLPVASPPQMRLWVLPVLGVFLGSSFTPQTLERAQQWPLSLLLVLVFTIACTALVAAYYRRQGFDRVTALFAAGPGAMSAMIATGAALGGDERRIALAQSLRITLLVFTLPAVVFALNPDHGVAAGFGDPGRTFRLFELIVLVGACTAATLAFVWLRVPTPQIAGPMLASAGLYASGLVAVPLPDVVLEITLWVLGSSVGARFAGIEAGELWRMTRSALGAVILALGLAFVFAAVLSAMLPTVGFLPALLALSPGGVAEMCLVAVAMDIDPSFVAVHHLSRMMLLMAATPFIGQWVARRA